MQSSYLKAQFYQQFFATSSGNDDNNVVEAKNMAPTITTKWRLLRTLWRLAAPTFIPAGFCQLITVLCQIAIPLLVRELLNTLEETPGEKVIKAGMPCTYMLFGRTDMLAYLYICHIFRQTEFNFIFFTYSGLILIAQ
jgi:hypothetical protein